MKSLDSAIHPFGASVFLTQTRSLDPDRILPMIGLVLFEFARQNLGLATFSRSSGSVAKKTSVRKLVQEGDPIDAKLNRL